MVRIRRHNRGRAFLKLLLIWACMLWPLPVPAQDGQAVARSIEERYGRSKTLQVTFLERYRQGRNVRIESGTAYFSRPGRMRWEYEAPEEKLFLVDGTNAWFYVPADRTATRAKLKESDDWHVPLALLAGKVPRGMFSRMCARLEALPASAGYALKCIPKKDKAPFSELRVEADLAFYLTRLVVREPGDVETEFRFADWREEVPLAEVLFHFSAPRGVAIVDEQSLTGTNR